MHAGNRDLGDLGERFLRCFVEALDDAGMPDDAAFREAMRSYMRWAVDDVLSYPERKDVGPGKAMPRWSWNGLQSQGLSP
jgi:hemoglobin